MFISSKQLSQIIQTNKAQQAQIQSLNAQVEALQLSIKELTEERQFLSDGEIDTLKEQLINNDEFEYALSRSINDYLSDNIADYCDSYIDNHRYVVTDLVIDKLEDIFEDGLTIKIER